MQQQPSHEHAQLGPGGPFPNANPRRPQIIPGDRHRLKEALPNELLLHIFSYVEERKDLANLCQCSKAFRNIADGYLYRSLNLDFRFDPGFGQGDGIAPHKLLQSIQNPRYSSVVKELRVSVDGCPAGWEVPPDGCPCDKIDTLLRKALCYAEKLEVLRIQCLYCRLASSERHCYLTELHTMTLREFCSDCNCGHYEDSSCFGDIRGQYEVGSYTKSVPAPNWVRSVTSLNLKSGRQWACPEEMLQRWMQNDELFPNLHTLNYYGPGICSELLAKRVIRRLVALSANPNDALRMHPDKKALTHLITRDRFLKTFPTSVGNINQFSNLQHIGFLWSDAIYDIPEELRLEIVNERLESIVDLKQLVSIQVLASSYGEFIEEETDPWHRELFKRLESAHPKLRRFFLMGASSCVWVLREDSGVWGKRSIRGLSSWDIGTGVYDDI